MHFQKFQRHNGQIGIALRCCCMPASPAARAAQAEVEAERLKAALVERNQIVEMRRAFEEARKA
jgi:hypothetical protein